MTSMLMVTKKTPIGKDGWSWNSTKPNIGAVVRMERIDADNDVSFGVLCSDGNWYHPDSLRKAQPEEYRVLEVTTLSSDCDCAQCVRPNEIILSAKGITAPWEHTFLPVKYLRLIEKALNSKEVKSINGWLWSIRVMSHQVEFGCEEYDISYYRKVMAALDDLTPKKHDKEIPVVEEVVVQSLPEVPELDTPDVIVESVEEVQKL
jgi:hypothetical protein